MGVEELSRGGGSWDELAVGSVGRRTVRSVCVTKGNCFSQDINLVIINDSQSGPSGS